MMNVFEKIREKLKETKTKGYVTGITNNPYEFGACSALDRAVEIVNQVEQEHNNGWIACSDRLPEEKGWYQCSCIVHGQEMVRDLFFYVSRQDFVDNIRYSEHGCQNIEKFVWSKYVIAWQPLPQPYKGSDTNGN